MPIIQKNYRDKFAYDLNKNPITKAELWDEYVLNQSIELIIATYFGERLFNPFFGSPVGKLLFDTINEDKAKSILSDLIATIQKWENRITIIIPKSKIIVDLDNNSISLDIPYVINKNNIVSRFEKKIIT